MRLNRFIGDFELKIGNLKLDDRELFNQLKNVLKLRPGERIILGDGKKNEGIAEIKEYGRDFAGVEIVELQQNQNEPESHVTLYCAVLKRENFELVVQKATEIGVKEIVPVITERTIKLNVRQDRLEKIIREAAEQSGRGIVPVLHEPVKFKDAVQNITENNGVNIVFDSSGINLNEALNTNPLILNTSIWVGPEGGWTDQELESAGGSGFKIINLGKLTLRAETAAITATYLVVNNFYCRQINP